MRGDAGINLYKVYEGFVQTCYVVCRSSEHLKLNPATFCTVSDQVSLLAVALSKLICRLSLTHAALKTFSTRPLTRWVLPRSHLVVHKFN